MAGRVEEGRVAVWPIGDRGGWGYRTCRAGSLKRSVSPAADGSSFAVFVEVASRKPADNRGKASPAWTLSDSATIRACCFLAENGRLSLLDAFGLISLESSGSTTI